MVYIGTIAQGTCSGYLFSGLVQWTCSGNSLRKLAQIGIQTAYISDPVGLNCPPTLSSYIVCTMSPSSQRPCTSAQSNLCQILIQSKLICTRVLLNFLKANRSDLKLDMTWRVQAKREHNNGSDRFFAQIRVMYVLSAALASQ